MSTLTTLYDDYGTSPWIDNLQRSWLLDGTLQRLLQSGVRGLTSNPTIFAHAISNGSEYDTQIHSLKGATADDAYWDLVLADIGDACDIMLPLFRSTGGVDGFVSVEVDPRLARKSDETIQAAEWIWKRVNRENLLVKIPATKEGVSAVREVIGRGISVNVTLIFSVERYEEVITAFQDGLATLAQGSPDKLSSVHSVASFFISRTDTKVDALVQQLGNPHLAGKAAVAQATVAYQRFLERFSTPAWKDLAAQGAHAQRPLWASTSTKNPAYPDLLYVESLIAPQCVNTMPQATLEAYLDHGTPSFALLNGADQAASTLTALQEAGVDLGEVARELEDEGVASFASSHESILQLVGSKL
jgi:transaldolase